MNDRLRFLLAVLIGITLPILIGCILFPIGFGFLILGLAGESDTIGDGPSIGIGLACWGSIPFLLKLVHREIEVCQAIRTRSPVRFPRKASWTFAFLACPLALLTFVCPFNEDFRPLEPYVFFGGLGASIVTACLWRKRI